MVGVYGILADLDLCVGCYACEVACRQENDVPLNKRRIRVVAVEPEELGGKLRMDFVPMMTDGCTFCGHRLKEALLPRCVDNCPTGALAFRDSPTAIITALQSGKRLQVCKLGGSVQAFG